MLIVVLLPAPLGPRKPKTSPASDGERDAADGLDLAVGLDEGLDLDGGWVGGVHGAAHGGHCQHAKAFAASPPPRDSSGLAGESAMSRAATGCGERDAAPGGERCARCRPRAGRRAADTVDTTRSTRRHGLSSSVQPSRRVPQSGHGRFRLAYTQWSGRPSRRPVVLRGPSRIAWRINADAHVDQLDESADRPDRLVRRDAGDERHLDRVDVPKPGDVALLEERGGNGDLSLTHEPAATTSRSGGVVAQRSGPRWPTICDSPAVATTFRMGTSTAVSSPPSNDSSSRLRNGWASEHGPTTNDPSRRR